MKSVAESLQYDIFIFLTLWVLHQQSSNASKMLKLAHVTKLSTAEGKWALSWRSDLLYECVAQLLAQARKEQLYDYK